MIVMQLHFSPFMHFDVSCTRHCNAYGCTRHSKILTAWIISPQSVEMLQLLYASALCSPTNSGTFEWVGDFVTAFCAVLAGVCWCIYHQCGVYHKNMWKGNIHVYSIVYLLLQSNYLTIGVSANMWLLVQYLLSR